MPSCRIFSVPDRACAVPKRPSRYSDLSVVRDPFFFPETSPLLVKILPLLLVGPLRAEKKIK